MEDGTEGTVQPETEPAKPAASKRKILWYLPHLAAVYGITHFCTPWLAGWTRRILLSIEFPTSSGSLQFLFSHVLAFSFTPAFLAGLTNARFRHKVAQWVWVVPTVVLGYKLVTFSPPRSVFQNTTVALWERFSLALHQYFVGGFLIREFQDWYDFWSIVRSNPDMARGMDQLRFTAPFYAGVGYSVAAWIGLRTELHQKIADNVKRWEQWKFGRDQ